MQIASQGNLSRRLVLTPNSPRTMLSKCIREPGSPKLLWEDRFRATPATRRTVVNARDFVVSIFYAIVLAIPFACDRVPDVNTPPETKPGNTARFPERIVFVSDRETSPLRQIYVMRGDGSERTRVTHDLNDYINPAFSPMAQRSWQVCTQLTARMKSTR